MMNQVKGENINMKLTGIIILGEGATPVAACSRPRHTEFDKIHTSDKESSLVDGLFSWM